MKAIVNTDALGKELKKINPAIKKNVTIPILSCVLLQFNKKELTIRATDLETTVVVNMDCESKDTFDVVMEYSDLSDVCGRINEPITIEKKEKHVLITSSDSNFKFPVVGEQEHFPSVPEESFLFSVDVESDFFSSLYSANTCKHKNDAQTNMNTPCIDFKKSYLTVVGIDGFMMFKKDLKIKTDRTGKYLIRENFVQMTKSFPEAKISFGEKFIKAEHGNTTIITLQPEGKFVDYGVIVPKEPIYNLKVNRYDLISALNKAGLAANSITKLCSLNFEGGVINVSSQDIDFGKEGKSRIIADHEVEIKTIGVGGNQILQLLNIMDSEEVEMAITGENKSIYLKPSDDEDTFCLLQPVALN